jgi:hypothetical protein
MSSILHEFNAQKHINERFQVHIFQQNIVIE